MTDYNDNSPEFRPNATYSLKISEGLDVQSEVLRFDTLDRDKGQVITYRMDLDTDNFLVTERTGG